MEKVIADMPAEQRTRYLERLNYNNLRLEKIGDVIRKQYGENLTNTEVLEIDKAILENERCVSCEGVCSKEHDNGYIYVINKKKNGVEIRFEPCRYKKAKLIKAEMAENIRNAEIPSQYQNLTFGDYQIDNDNRTATKFAKWCLESQKGLYIHGLPGVGKTMLAGIIANESLKLGRSVIFSKVADLLRNIRATYSKDSKKNEIDILQKIYDCDVLIIDDMRPECGKKFVGETLFDIIDSRYNSKKQTIVTSNGTIEQVRDALNNPTDTKFESLDGTRIYDRCKEMLKIAFITGNSRRGRFKNVD